MTFTATGEPLNMPPRILLALDTGVAGATFHSLSVTRDGTLIRNQPPTGSQATSTYDYEMPFGQLVEYTAQGDYLPFVAPDFTETWWLVTDSYDRANSAVTMGSPELGGTAYTAHTGTWGIQTNQAYLVSGTAGVYNRVTTDAGVSDCTVEVTIGTQIASGDMGLLVRASGTGAGFAILDNQMWDTAAGSVGAVFSQAFVSGDRMRVRLSGNDITVSRQAAATGPWVQVMFVNTALYNTNTRHGLTVFDNTAPALLARFNNFNLSRLTPTTPWSGDLSSFALDGGQVTSSTYFAEIVRTASGTIQRFEVTDPDNIFIGVSSSTDQALVDVGSANGLTALGTLVGDGTVTTGSGSYTVTMLDGIVTVTALDSSWELSAEYTGTPTKLRVISIGGQYQEIAGAFSSVGRADRIAIGAAGNIYTLDIPAKLVRKFSSAGAFLTSWSTTNTPVDLALDSSENVYTTEQPPAHLVRKFSSTGTPLTTWTVGGGLNYPQGIGVDSSNNVYVYAYNSDTIYKTNSTGTPIANWANGIGSDNNTDKNLAVLPGGSTVYTWAYDDPSDDLTAVSLFTNTGTLLDQFDIPGGAFGMNVDSTGQIYLFDSSTVNRYTAAGVLNATLNVAPHVLARSGAITSTGTLVTGDITDSMVHYWTPGTASVGSIEVTPSTSLVAYFETTTTTLNIGEAWLIHPGQPSLSVSIDSGTWRDIGINVDPLSAQQTTAKSAVTLHQPVGRTRSVAIATGNRLEDEWDLVLFAPTVADRDAVKAIVHDQTPLLLRSPTAFNWDLADGFYSVADIPVNRLTPNLTNGYRRITLPLIPSDSPVVATASDRTYADLLTDSVDYAGLLVIYDTYTDLLLGTA